MFFPGNNNLKLSSRPLPGYFLLVLLLCNACSKKPVAKKQEEKIVKTVPAVYVSVQDSHLVKRKDTVFYQGKYFTGLALSLYNDKDSSSIQSYFNGVEEGWQKKWYPGGQLAEERFFINGKKEGCHRGWWPNGSPRYIFNFYDGEYNGEFKEWYSNGILGKQFHYENGYENGSQRLWWENGTVRANYVIRNGKKYGLIGLKTCINPYDSIIKK